MKLTSGSTGAAVQFAGLFGNVHRLVRDPLQVIAELHGGHDVPQVARHRLEAPQQVDPVLVHFLLELVDLLVVGDGHVAQFLVPVQQAAERIAQAPLAKARHHEEIVLQPRQSRVVGGEDVFALFRHDLSSKSSADVIFGLLFVRLREQLAGGIVLDEAAQVEKGRPVRDAAGLLHVMSHDDDRVLFAQLVD